MAKSGMDDLFGHVPQKGDLLDAPAAAQAPVSKGPPVQTPDTVRVIMLDLLAEARAATVIPWNAFDLRYHTAMYPYYAEWLKGGEGDRLMAEFKAEMDRLNAPVDQLGPNWRKIWGLAA